VLDQICIDQNRVKERNQQVSMMGDIFKSARKVSVWLGEDCDDSRAGMQLAKQLLHIAQHRHITNLSVSDLEPHGLPRRGHKRWVALAAILRRPWFWRTWIIQEVVLNPNVELVLGANVLTWDELEAIVSLLEGPFPVLWQLDQAVFAAELPFSRINRIRLRHRRMIATPVTPVNIGTYLDGATTAEPDAIDGTIYEEDPELLDLLLMSRGLAATDPRDKIYALLGLGKHDIIPDYDSPADTVFTDFAMQTIGAATVKISDGEKAGIELSTRDREIRRALLLLACAGRPNQRLPNLASWVPDWTVNLASRPLIFGHGHHLYAAGGDKLGHFDWEVERGLVLSGILVDTVQTAGSVLLESDVSTDLHSTIEHWWTESKQIAFDRIARSPGSTTYTDAFEAMRRRLSICKHGYFVGDSYRRRRPSLLDDVESAKADAAHNATQTLTFGPTRGRVMFATTTGYLGLVPHGTREGDVIMVIRGADVPYVLRPQGEAYELIGEAYVQGIMDGEALEMPNLWPVHVMIR
jgi:hypothetical protein